MKNIFLTLLIFNIIISCWHKLDSKVEKAVNILSEETSINTTWSEENEAYKNLLRVATLEDLIYLTEDKNPYVRYYSFLALREKNYPKIKDIYFNHIQDTTETLNTNNGACLRGTISVNDLMFSNLNPEQNECKYGFTQKEFDKLAKERYDKAVEN